MNTNTTHYHILDGELLCTAGGETSVYVSRALYFTPCQLRHWRDMQNLRVRAVATGKHQPACNMMCYQNGSVLRYCTCRTFPRPVRRPRRALVELTCKGLETVRNSARKRIRLIEEEYSDLTASAQEGASISPAQWNALVEDHARATRLYNL